MFKNEALELWSNSVDSARGDRKALEALLIRARAAEGPEARAAQMRIQRFLKEIDRSSGDHPSLNLAGGREISPELASVVVDDLEADDGFLIDGDAIPSLLKQALAMEATRAVQILSTLARYKAFSPLSLMQKLGGRDAYLGLPDAAKEWLWAFALTPGAGYEVEDVLKEWLVPFPRRLLPLGKAREATETPAGYVYLLRESGVAPCTLKIGMTTKPVEERIASLNASTSQHRELVLLMEWPVADPRESEQKVHDALAQYRVRTGREFFQLEAREAIRMIDALLGR